MRSNNYQGRRRKEVSPKLEEPLKEHPKRKRSESRSKSLSDRSTMKKEFHHQIGDQKCRRNDINLEARKRKRKSMEIFIFVITTKLI